MLIDITYWIEFDDDKYRLEQVKKIRKEITREGSESYRIIQKKFNERLKEGEQNGTKL